MCGCSLLLQRDSVQCYEQIMGFVDKVVGSQGGFHSEYLGLKEMCLAILVEHLDPSAVTGF